MESNDYRALSGGNIRKIDKIRFRSSIVSSGLSPDIDPVCSIIDAHIDIRDFVRIAVEVRTEHELHCAHIRAIESRRTKLCINVLRTVIIAIRNGETAGASCQIPVPSRIVESPYGACSCMVYNLPIGWQGATVEILENSAGSPWRLAAARGDQIEVERGHPNDKGFCLGLVPRHPCRRRNRIRALRKIDRIEARLRVGPNRAIYIIDPGVEGPARFRILDVARYGIGFERVKSKIQSY